MNIHRAKPCGFSLISLMIGMLVAMIAVLGMMSLYRTVVRNTVESNADIRATGDGSLALLMAHIYLHDAGYGIPSPSITDDLQSCTSATLNTQANTITTSGCTAPADGEVNTLLWRFDDGEKRCAGLHSFGQGFYYLAPVICGENWPATWQLQWLLDGAAITIEVETFTTSDTPCRALGAAGSGGVAVTLASEHAGSETSLDSTTCLVNFPFPAVNPP
ncbi:MAG: hypothetical protein WC997_06810 [Porticoccaceae bacterium]